MELYCTVRELSQKLITKAESTIREQHCTINQSIKLRKILKVIFIFFYHHTILPTVSLQLEPAALPPLAECVGSSMALDTSRYFCKVAADC